MTNSEVFNSIKNLRNLGDALIAAISYSPLEREIDLLLVQLDLFMPHLGEQARGWRFVADPDSQTLVYLQRIVDIVKQGQISGDAINEIALLCQYEGYNFDSALWTLEKVSAVSIRKSLEGFASKE
jgi:hypothetical protein